MTTKELVRQEIERREKILTNVYEEQLERKDEEMMNYYHGKVVALEELLSFLGTLQEPSTWIKFSPANNLPRERVTIAYHTHDERKVRYAYGYFQFNPSKNWEFCGFAKDGNEQPKRVKTEDILYWKPVESLPMEETHSLREWQEILANNPEMMEEFERQTPPEPIRGSILQEPSLPSSLDEAAMNYIAPIENEDGLKVINFSGRDIKDAFIAGAEWQSKRDQDTIKTAEDHAFLAGADWQRLKDEERR